MLLRVDPPAAPDVPPSPPRDGGGSPQADGPSAEARRPPLKGLPVLRLIRPLAVLTLIAMLLGRMLAPATVGLAVGIERISRAVELAGAAASQLLAISAVVVAMALISDVVRSRNHIALRLAAIVGGSFVILVVLHATARRVPELSAGLLGVTAAVLALLGAWQALRVSFTRLAGVALGLAGASSLVRLLGVLLAMWANDRSSKPLASTTSAVATAAFALDALAVFVSLAALGAGRAHRKGSGGEPRELPRLASPLTVAALALAFLATRAALAGAADDAATIDTLARRALERLLTRPAPMVPHAVQLFVAALSVAVAALVLAAPPRLPAVGGALALLLIARSAPEVPLNALALVVAALCLVLAAGDERGFWAAVLAKDRAPKERAPRGSGEPETAEGRPADAGNGAR